MTDNPFKRLQGLSAADLPQSAEQDIPPRQVDSVKKTPDPSGEEGEDDELFAREMASLGVERETGGEDDVPPRSRNSSSSQLAATGSSTADDDLLFQRAVGHLDKTFKEEAAAEDPLLSSGPRRARQLKRGSITPEAEIDLHGLTRDKALTRVGFFLENARHHGYHCVLIITGKGSPSTGGAVLRTAVLEWLAANREYVLEWVEAPRRHGGSGALVVFLRRPSKVL